MKQKIAQLVYLLKLMEVAQGEPLSHTNQEELTWKTQYYL